MEKRIMYSIDANLLMNTLLAALLLTGAFLFILTLVSAAIFWRRGSTLLSWLYVLTSVFGVFAVLVGILGLRGRTSDAPPWHFFLDMKYQPKYTAQGGSSFFPDGRASRLPPPDTVPYDGTDYFADAGYHQDPQPDFLQADRRYYTGIANPTAMRDEGGNRIPEGPRWQNGQLVGEGYYVNHIPPFAVQRAGGWAPLIRRGRQQFDIHCAVCHGASGRGGVADAAYGIVGAYGLSVPPSNLVTPEIQAQPDGQLFHTITYGVRNMPAYAHQVSVHDRWAIIAYLRVLQFAAGNPLLKQP
jgi:mono/diheme cytochrome c family protein